MPTPNPRMAIVVSAEQHELLMELGALQGRSAASYVRELLDMATPMFRAVLPLLRASADVQERASSMISDRMQGIMAEARATVPADGQADLEAFLAEMNAVVHGEGSQPRAAASTSAPERRK